MPSREEVQLDSLIAEVTGNAEDDSAAVTAFTEAIQAALKVPVLCLVLGDRVQLEGVELPNPRRGIVALPTAQGRPFTAGLVAGCTSSGQEPRRAPDTSLPALGRRLPMIGTAPVARASVAMDGDVMNSRTSPDAQLASAVNSTSHCHAPGVVSRLFLGPVSPSRTHLGIS